MKTSMAKLSKPICKYDCHTHEDWEITLMLSGTATISIGEKFYDTQEGDVMILPPNTPHSGRSDGFFTDLSVRVSYLDFSKPLIVYDYDNRIQTLMMLVYKERLEQAAGYQQLCSHLAECILQYLHKLANDTCKYDFLKKLRAEMHENISNPDFELSAAIQRLGYHPDYVRRCFHEEFQTTPLQYITALRLNYAKTLLKRESFIGIEHVAEQCGFRDSFYFSTAFRKHFGLSPSAYRKVR